jgi:hypothetical protein
MKEVGKNIGRIRKKQQPKQQYNNYGDFIFLDAFLYD